MSTVSRPLLANILIAIVAIGHAPAWLHVATTPHVTVRQGAPGNRGTEHGYAVSRPMCGCTHNQQTASADNTGNPIDDGSDESEHDDCVLCQSLFGTLGFVDASNEDLCVQPLVTKLVCIDRGMIVSPLRSWVQPRGPPTVNS